MWRRKCIHLALVILLVGLVDARITHTQIRDDGRRSITLSQPFGFTTRGEPHLNITICDPKIDGSEPHLSKMAFYLVRASFNTLITDTSDGKCDPEKANLDAGVYKIGSFGESPLIDWVSHDDKKHTGCNSWDRVGGPELPGEHTLYFVNCNKPGISSVTFDIEVQMFNKFRDGKSYLSVGEIELPNLYLIMFLLFSVGLGTWCYTVHQNRNNAHRIHYLMIGLGAVKVLTLLTQCGMYHYIRVTGTPDGWNVAYYIFTFFRSVLLFTCIILIGTGWSYMTPFLGDKERRVLFIVLPLQVLMDMAIIITDEFTPARREWFAWRDLMQIADIVCCCAILFPIAWRIRHLREAAVTDGKAVRSMQQLVMFRQFYIMVVVYIYFTRIVVQLLNATLAPEYSWLSSAALELATLAFYTLTAMQFAPSATDGNSYTRLVSEAEIEMGSF